MALKDFLKKKLSKDPDFQAAEKNAKIQRLITERAKTSNERELERFMEENRQKIIKEHLERIRKKQTREHFSGGLMDTTNIFKGHKSVLTNDRPVLKLKKGAVKLKRQHKVLNIKKAKKKGGMFFK